jgi:hypothetical protein
MSNSMGPYPVGVNNVGPYPATSDVTATGAELNAAAAFVAEAVDENGNLTGTVITRNGTTAELAQVVLEDGQLGCDTTLHIIKIGDGTNVFPDLPVYASSTLSCVAVTALGSTVADAVALTGGINTYLVTGAASTGVKINIDAMSIGVPISLLNANETNAIILYGTTAGAKTVYFLGNGGLAPDAINTAGLTGITIKKIGEDAANIYIVYDAQKSA